MKYYIRVVLREEGQVWLEAESEEIRGNFITQIYDAMVKGNQLLKFGSSLEGNSVKTVLRCDCVMGIESHDRPDGYKHPTEKIADSIDKMAKDGCSGEDWKDK